MNVQRSFSLGLVTDKHDYKLGKHFVKMVIRCVTGTLLNEDGGDCSPVLCIYSRNVFIHLHVCKIVDYWLRNFIVNNNDSVSF